VYGTGSARAARAATVKLSIAPVRSALKLLKSGKHLRVALTVAFTATGGTPRHSVLHISVSVPRPKKTKQPR
jgi:hypothetical protein